MSDLPNNILIYTIFVLKIHSLKPHLWCCQTPSAFPPLSLRSYRRAQRGQTCHPQTPAAEVRLHLSRGASPLRCRLLVSLLELCLGFVLSNNQKKYCIELEYPYTHAKKILQEMDKENITVMLLTFLLLSLRCWTNFIRSAGSVMILKLNFSTERHLFEERNRYESNTEQQHKGNVRWMTIKYSIWTNNHWVCKSDQLHKSKRLCGSMLFEAA